MRLTGLVLVLVGIGVCAFGCYFAAKGLFARSTDNALMNYVLLAVPPLVLGGAMTGLGVRTAKGAPRRSKGHSS
jgi:hypothetical protein